MNTVISPIAPSNIITYDTPEKRAKYMDAFISSSETYLGTLYQRWQDEKEYEDINDYKKAMNTNIIPKDMALLSLDKKFNLKLAIQGFPYNVLVSVKNRIIEWKSIAKK